MAILGLKFQSDQASMSTESVSLTRWFFHLQIFEKYGKVVKWVAYCRNFKRQRPDYNPVYSQLSLKRTPSGQNATVRFREVPALGRAQLQRDGWNSAGTKFALRLIECLLWESWLYYIFHAAWPCRVTILKDKDSRESRGVAFVLFLDRQSAYKAVNGVNKKQVWLAVMQASCLRVSTHQCECRVTMSVPFCLDMATACQYIPMHIIGAQSISSYFPTYPAGRPGVDPSGKPMMCITMYYMYVLYLVQAKMHATTGCMIWGFKEIVEGNISCQHGVLLFPFLFHQMFGRTIKCCIANDNGRATEFIRRKNYPDKTRCYECGVRLFINIYFIIMHFHYY